MLPVPVPEPLATRTIWKVITVDDDKVEKFLNILTKDKWIILNIHPLPGVQWRIFAHKEIEVN